MKRLIALTSIGAALLASFAVAVAGASSSSGSGEPFAQVSNRGAPFAIPAALKQRMGLDGYGSISRLATTNGSRYLRFSAGARDCYGNGSVTGALPVTVIKCVNGPPHFPSSSKPILDLSVVEVDGRGSSSYVRLGGIAADGIEQIGVLNEAGDILQRVFVVANVYDSADIKPGTVAALVALDANGAIVAGGPR
jgi:hypothetical protein